MLEGHDAVAYFTRHDAVRGDPAIRLEHKGVTWRFASEANRAEFERAPDKYMPQFGGYCKLRYVARMRSRGVAQEPPRNTYRLIMNLPLYSPTAPAQGRKPG
jgi:hypothetical protein